MSAAVRVALGPELVALVLVGGYARGEGGSVETPSGFRPYNDYDLVAVVRDPARARPRLAAIGADWSRALGVHVDLWPVSEELVSAPPATLFWLDVALGGARVLVGDPRILAGARRIGPRAVPLSEATRLLANRAVGLALTNLSMPSRSTAIDDDAIRHVHKAVLAVGDARLLVADRYRGTVRERLRELASLASAPAVGDELVALYAEAASFRERPDRFRVPAGETSEEWYAGRVARIAGWHLEIEASRIGTPRDIVGYASAKTRIFDELPDVTPLRAMGAVIRAASRLSLPVLPWVGHPRERLARVAVLLAYGAPPAGSASTARERWPHARALAAWLLGLGGEAKETEILSALRRLIPLGG